MDDNKINQPDEETLHTSDPQEHMKGPVSSIVNKVAEIVDPQEPVEENATSAASNSAKTFKEVQNTNEEALYQQKLEQFLQNHSEYLMGDLKSRILENPDEYVEVHNHNGNIELQFKVKP